MLEYDRSKRKWILYTRDGSRILGTHKTKKDALRQERAILWSQSKRKNPYSKTDSEGYLINPSAIQMFDDETIWWHYSEEWIDEFVYRAESERGESRYTFLASTPQIVHYLEGFEGFLYQVQIRPKNGAYVLERDDVFEKVSDPISNILDNIKWNKRTGSLRYVTEPLAKRIEINYPSLFRHFSTFSCMREPFKSALEKQNLDSFLLDILAFNISLYLGGFEAVQALFFRDLTCAGASSVDARIPHLLSNLGFHGWFEREVFKADVNIGIDLKYYDAFIVEEEKLDSGDDDY